MSTSTLPETAVVGIFHDREEARLAIEDLRHAGFEEHQIGLLTQNAAGEAVVEDLETETKAAQGAAAGVATGAGVGALWAIGIAAGFLPAIGPAIAGGLLASLLASAAGGAVVGGLVGALVGLGIPQEEAQFYEAEVRAGKTLVTVNAFHRAAEATAIFTRHGGDVRPTASEKSENLTKSGNRSAQSAAEARPLPEADGYSLTGRASEWPDTVPHQTPHVTSDLPHAELDEDDMIETDPRPVEPTSDRPRRPR